MSQYKKRKLGLKPISKARASFSFWVLCCSLMVSIAPIQTGMTEELPRLKGLQTLQTQQLRNGQLTHLLLITPSMRTKDSSAGRLKAGSTLKINKNARQTPYYLLINNRTPKSQQMRALVAQMRKPYVSSVKHSFSRKLFPLAPTSPKFVVVDK